MHLLVVTTSFPNRSNPGSGIFIRRMLDRLPDNLRVTVLTPDGTLPSFPETSGDRIRVIHIRYAPRSWQILAHQPGGIPGVLRTRPWSALLLPGMMAAMLIATLKAARRADLIHAQWAFCGLPAGIAGKLRKVPVVTSLLGSDVLWARQSRFFRWLLYWCAELNCGLTTVSTAMAAEVAAWVKSTRIPVRVIPNGIELCFLSGEPEPGEHFSVVSIGNLIPVKGVELVLLAVKNLSCLDGNVRLDIIGDGPQRLNLETLARKAGLAENVRFHGLLAPDAVAAQLIRSHVLVLASYSEGQPNVVLEAMASGVPVVVADIPGMRELVEHGRTGLLFPPGNVDRLTECLECLWGDRSYGRQLAAAARLEIRDRGRTWSRTAREYAGFYLEILDQWRNSQRPFIPPGG